MPEKAINKNSDVTDQKTNTKNSEIDLGPEIDQDKLKYSVGQEFRLRLLNTRLLSSIPSFEKKIVESNIVDEDSYNGFVDLVRKFTPIFIGDEEFNGILVHIFREDNLIEKTDKNERYGYHSPAKYTELNAALTAFFRNYKEVVYHDKNNETDFLKAEIAKAGVSIQHDQMRLWNSTNFKNVEENVAKTLANINFLHDAFGNFKIVELNKENKPVEVDKFVKRERMAEIFKLSLQAGSSNQYSGLLVRNYFRKKGFPTYDMIAASHVDDLNGIDAYISGSDNTIAFGQCKSIGVNFPEDEQDLAFYSKNGSFGVKGLMMEVDKRVKEEEQKQGFLKRNKAGTALDFRRFNFHLITNPTSLESLEILNKLIKAVFRQKKIDSPKYFYMAEVACLNIEKMKFIREDDDKKVQGNRREANLNVDPEVDVPVILDSKSRMILYNIFDDIRKAEASGVNIPNIEHYRK